MIVQGCKKKFLMEIRWKIVETTKKYSEMKNGALHILVMRRRIQIFLKLSLTFSKKLLRLA